MPRRTLGRTSRRTIAPDLREGSDEEIVAACLAGDDRGWDALIDRYGSYIYAVAVRAFRLDQASAAEVFQDACVRMYDGLRGYAGRGELRAWIRAVTISACREHLRQAGRRRDSTVEPEASEELESVDAMLDVRRAVGSLGEPCRTTIELHFFEDLTQAQVAKRLRVAPGTIAARLSRCVRRLRDMLQEPPPREPSR